MKKQKIIVIENSFHCNCIFCQLKSLFVEDMVQKLDKEITLDIQEDKNLKKIEDEVKKKYSSSFIKKAKKIK